MVAPSIQLLSRALRVTVGKVRIDNFGQQVGLDVWFQVTRSLKPGTPNSASLRLYNLSEASRKAIEAAAQPVPGAATAPGTPKVTAVPVEIIAGYEGGTSTIFLGEMRSAQTVRQDGVDDVIELETGDGDEAMLLARSTTHIPGGTNAYEVAQQLLKDAKLAVGNIASVADILKSAPIYKRGVTLKGSSFDHLRDLARSCGLEVSIQGQAVQWLSLGQPLSGAAYKLSPDTGLVGSPSCDTKGVLTCETLLLPGLRPGSPVALDAKYVTGLFRVTSIETTGDTTSDDWGHKLECKRYAPATRGPTTGGTSSSANATA